MNSLRLALDIGGLCADNNTGMVAFLLVQTDEVTFIDRKQSTLVLTGEAKNLIVGDGTIGVASFQAGENIVSKST
ncbi:MAG: hypothetical protein Q7T47_08685 [Anaerolineales bacterium]|nr:hypothetical protein [Anaerolineales bacterium]